MSTIQIGEYSAWVCIEGIAAPVYGVDKDSKSASCWVASQVGKVSHFVVYHPAETLLAYCSALLRNSQLTGII